MDRFRRGAFEGRNGSRAVRWGEAGQLRRLLPMGALLGLLLIPALSPVAASAQAPLLKANGKLAFVSFRDGNPEIYTTNPDGTQQVRLTTNPGSSDLPSDFWPSWSPDGAKIVYTSDRGGDGNLDVWTMNPDGTGQSRITTSPAGDLDPALSPDGTKVVFVRGLFSPSGPPVFDIYSVNLNGTGETNLTQSDANETEPAVSPDGSKIAFERELEGGNHDIFIMNTDGTEEKQLTDTPAHEGHPNFSPDGTKIVFDDNFHAEEPSVRGFIYTMNTDGSGRAQLTTREDRHGLAAFSPDGTRISFTASEDIWTMNADGSNQVQVTSHPAPDIQSSWQPIAGTSSPPAGTSPPPAGTPPPDTTKPALKLSVSPAIFRTAGSGATISRKRKVGTRVSYRLSEAASVKFRVERASSGRRSQGKCAKPRRANRRGKRCTRYVTLRGSFSHKGKAGSNKLKFRGRLRGRKLRPGRYRLRAVATDAAKNHSSVKRKRFRIVIR